MKMTQTFLIILAIVFAIALALTIAMISLSYMRVESEDTRPPVTDTTRPLPQSTTLWLPEVTTPEVTTVPEEITMPSNSLSFASAGDGTCTVVGIGSCTDACVVIPAYSPAGDKVTTVAARALYGQKQINAIQIPATVEHIGALAFANCPNLVYISVSDQNEEYCDIDGILYTSDGRELLLYPPMRAGASVTISLVTTEIAEMAFYNCAYLSHVYYTGTPEQWERISIGAKNYSLTAAAKTFG
ncbi:MAG: hypothetical protein E7659_03465 [Ruminococcaceae bacterium]|nr:hypothetical protein [Oscillospiraceae bacterium]